MRRATDVRDLRLLTARIPIRQMASPPAHRIAVEPRRGTHHARTHLHTAGDGKLEALEETPIPTEDELQALTALHSPGSIRSLPQPVRSR